jgi:UDP:flavonoid glycosyltransferase YjiC (YdhE family)
MAHFGVVAPAFYSHYSALGALGAELAARGHRVTFLHRPDAAAYVSAPGLGFHAIGAATRPARSPPPCAAPPTRADRSACAA